MLEKDIDLKKRPPASKWSLWAWSVHVSSCIQTSLPQFCPSGDCLANKKKKFSTG